MDEIAGMFPCFCAVFRKLDLGDQVRVVGSVAEAKRDGRIVLAIEHQDGNTTKVAVLHNS